MHTNDLRKLERETNDGVLRGPALGAADEIDRLRAEIERLTKERDAQYDENVNRIAMQAKAETERDAAMALLADAYGAGTGGSVIESLLADAERDMRQRAADLCENYRHGKQGMAAARAIKWAIVNLPLKHADRAEENAAKEG